MDFLNELTNNITLLLSLLFIYGLARPYLLWLSGWRRDILQGVIFGIFAVIAMMIPFHIAPGLIYDGRVIILGIASLFGGVVPGIIALVMMLIYRISIGGPGVIIGIGSGVTAVIVALLIGYYLKRQKQPVSIFWLIVIGVLEGLQTIVWSSLAPFDLRQQVLETISLPIMILYPVGFTVAGLLFLYMEHRAALSEALHTSEEHYRTIISVMAEGLIVRYTDGRPTTTNPQAKNLMGVLSDAMVALKDLPQGWRIIHEDGTDWVYDEIPSVVAMWKNQPTRGAIMGLQNPQGAVQWLSISSHPLIKPGESAPYGSVTSFADITTERNIRQELAHERNMLRTLIDNIPDYVFIKDRRGRFILSNESHAQAVQLSPDKLVGKTAFDAFPFGLASQFTADDLSVMQDGEPLLNIERVSQGPDGDQKIMLTSKIPLKNSAGKSIGLIGISRDITARKHLEQQTLELAAERERIALLDKFITDISHDFKTPLTVISSSVYLLQKAQDPARKEKQIKNLETQAARLTQLFDDFLTMTNLDSEAYPMDKQPVNINRVVDTVVQATMPLTLEKHHSLSFRPASDLPQVVGDALWLQRAISQVITNAINFTAPGGEITIRTYVKGPETIIEIQDTGVGIPEDNLSHIFDRLYRGDESRSTGSGGSGLGLPIAIRIMEAHRGTITVESTPGKGSTFRLHLPLHDAFEPVL